MVSYSKFSILSIAASTIGAVVSAHEVPNGMDMSKYASKLKNTRVNSNVRQGKADKGAKASKEGIDSTGALYTMTNDVENEILVYSRDVSHGQLTFEGSVPTTGIGGQHLAVSASSIIVAGECLLAVNSGSHDITTFRIKSPSEIEYAGKFESNGFLPMSLAEKEGLVYALNSGGSGSIQGYYLTQFNCGLIPFGSPVELRQNVDPGQTEAPITSAVVLPSEVVFTPQGDLLVIIKINDALLNSETEGTTAGPGSLNFYEIDPTDGSTSDDALTVVPVSLNGVGTIPFAFEADEDGRTIIVEAASTILGSSGAIAIYQNGELVERVQTGENGSCWVAYQREGSCIYTSQTSNSNISSLTLKNGPLELVDSIAVDVDVPVDMRLSTDERYLYVLSNGDLNGDTSHIIVYETFEDCHLNEVQSMGDGFTQMGIFAGSFADLNFEVGVAVYGL